LLQNRGHFVPVNGRLVLFVYFWNVNEFVVPVSHEKRFSSHVSRRSHNGFDDIHVVANCRRRQGGNMIDELFHGGVSNVGQILLEGVGKEGQFASPDSCFALSAEMHNPENATE
jgi:hypothetical protein